MRPVAFNGKFYAGGLNGVHRVADRLIREVDGQLCAIPPGQRPVTRLFAPADATWLPELSAIEIVREKGGGTQRWEQGVLPRRAAGAVLVNLCNLAPLFHRRKILLLHDVQFLFAESGYPARLRWGHRLLTPLMARTSRQVLTVSDYSRQLMGLTRISPRHRTAVLHNGADHLADDESVGGDISSLGVRPGGYILMFGSSKRYKNIGIVLQALADPRLSGFSLVIVGPGREELARAGLMPPPGTVFAGRVSDAMLHALYADALCLAFPSLTEGFGLPPIEAALCGCPSVVSPAGAIPEVCGDAVIYAGVDAADEWAAAFLGYAADPMMRAEKAMAARARADRFRWADAGRKLMAHILRLAA